MDNILLNLSAVEILGLTIIGEARGESIAGQVAVGSVIRNRLIDKPGRYHSYHDVCLESKQFSCWNESDPNRVILVELAEKLITGIQITDMYMKQCMFVAKGIENWSIMDNTNGALNYMTTKLYDSPSRPDWAEDSYNHHTIGNQIFFNA